ncbi:Uncharacterised protein [Corynebacterium cystitidis]|uniref:Uncharacterized protein n=2 Tax=Corynebacterium cystitidis TaxID=35757 RepID=A0A1H9UZW4_9CORY|nr:hypothetical protein SAMN05661109_02026 [Corynebacterium cystitidis DSM 20524]SNV91753.1 Uncharacterised protein [Corynebacterium cystitidis]
MNKLVMNKPTYQDDHWWTPSNSFLPTVAVVVIGLLLVIQWIANRADSSTVTLVSAVVLYLSMARSFDNKSHAHRAFGVNSARARRNALRSHSWALILPAIIILLGHRNWLGAATFALILALFVNDVRRANPTRERVSTSWRIRWTVPFGPPASRMIWVPMLSAAIPMGLVLGASLRFLPLHTEAVWAEPLLIGVLGACIIGCAALGGTGSPALHNWLALGLPRKRWSTHILTATLSTFVLVVVLAGLISPASWEFLLVFLLLAGTGTMIPVTIHSVGWATAANFLSYVMVIPFALEITPHPIEQTVGLSWPSYFVLAALGLIIVCGLHVAIVSDSLRPKRRGASLDDDWL